MASDAFVILVLLAVGWKYTRGLESVLDIGLYDESNYLHSGHSLLDIGFPSPGAAPLYAVWYFLLSKLQSDRVELYYLNYRVLTILVPIALYLLFRRTKLIQEVISY